MSFSDLEARLAQLEQQVATFRPSEAMVMAPKSQVVNASGVVTTQGPFFPTSGVDDATVGAIVWSNPGRITADDGSSADAALTSGAVSHYLKGTGYGFNLPGGSTVQGIQLDIKCQTQGGTNPTGGKQNSVKLVKGGIIAGNDLSTGLQLPTAALTYVTFGGPSQLWGLTWTAADINSTLFGAVFSVTNTLVAGQTVDPLADAMRITVTYIPPS